MIYGSGVQYFIDEQSRDWFESLHLFTKKYSLVIETDTGIIRSIAEDTSTLYPVGFSVVDIDDLPDGCSDDGTWSYDGITVNKLELAHDEILARNTRVFNTLLRSIADAAFPLQSAVSLGVATTAQTEALSALQQYSISLVDTDLTVDPVIWPEAPTGIAL